MKPVARNALAAACMALAAGAAWADAYSTVTVGNVTVTLIDLDPNDGIAAGISFLPDQKYLGGALVRGDAWVGDIAENVPGGQHHSFFNEGAWPRTNVAGSASTSLANVTVGVTGSAQGAGFSAFNLAGSALASDTHYSQFTGYASVPSNAARKGFILSPNTKVVFSVDATLNASTTVGYGAGSAHGESAMALMGLFVSGLAADGATRLEDLQERSVSVQYADGDLPGGGADSWNGLISSSFSNLGSQSSNGEFWAYANISGMSVISAVPEPASYGMLLGGLGLIGSIARRRKRAA